jgi:hypothetical protein
MSRRVVRGYLLVLRYHYFYFFLFTKKIKKLFSEISDSDMDIGGTALDLYFTGLDYGLRQSPLKFTGFFPGPDRG